MPAPQVISAVLETAINQALSWSSNRQTLLAPLSSKTCIIYLQEVQQAVIFHFGDARIEVCLDADNMYAVLPDDMEHGQCWVSVSIFALDKLKHSNQLTKLIKSGQLDFAGDLGILQSLGRLFGELDLDFEEVLSMYIGDASAYQLNTAMKKLALNAQQQFTLFTQTLSDAALDEKPIGVRKIMLINFCDEVSQLRADADRLEARIKNLEDQSSVNESGDESREDLSNKLPNKSPNKSPNEPSQ